MTKCMPLGGSYFDRGSKYITNKHIICDVTKEPLIRNKSSALTFHEWLDRVTLQHVWKSEQNATVSG